MKRYSCTETYEILKKLKGNEWIELRRELHHILDDLWDRLRSKQ